MENDCNQKNDKMKIKDIISAKAFEKDGFFVIEDFFDLITINEIQEFYDSFNFDTNPEINTNIKSCTKDENIQISEFLKEKFELSIKKNFSEYQLGGGVFIMKGTGNESVSTLHQDCNVVDEKKFTSLSIWCPLIDVDEHNGCLQVLPGSHQWFDTIRSFNIPSHFINFEDVEGILRPVPLKAGSAVIFAHNLFHGSKPNYSNDFRIAATFSIVSKDAQGIHFIKNGDKIQICIADEDFLLNKARLLFEGEVEIGAEIIDEFPESHRFLIKKDDVIKKVNQLNRKKFKLKNLLKWKR